MQSWVTSIIKYISLLAGAFLVLAREERRGKKIGKLEVKAEINESILNDIQTVKENDFAINQMSREQLIKFGSQWDTAGDDNEL